MHEAAKPRAHSWRQQDLEPKLNSDIGKNPTVGATTTLAAHHAALHPAIPAALQQTVYPAYTPTRAHAFRWWHTCRPGAFGGPDGIR